MNVEVIRIGDKIRISGGNVVINGYSGNKIFCTFNLAMCENTRVLSYDDVISIGELERLLEEYDFKSHSLAIRVV